MKLIVFESAEDQARGLQHRRPIEPETLFAFPGTREGALFHSRNVTEPFDLAFLSAELVVLHLVTLVPPAATALAPPGTALTVEAKAGELQAWGFAPGRVAFAPTYFAPGHVENPVFFRP
jgi:uncharacterized membrane protein (UPF0127 family)